MTERKQAAIRAMEKAGSNEKPLEIRTDSQYVIKGSDHWVNNWQRNNWRTAGGGDVKHRDLWEKIHTLRGERPGGVHFVNAFSSIAK